ncbi:MAG: DHH family phosphoesterase [Desulfobacterales bacterium]|nr:DHH family phosphoesterase [Desulfobacterales bacterium]
MNRLPFKKETQQNLKKLLELAHPDDSLLLLMHGSPDPDAIASAMALREILQRKKGLSKCTFAATEPFRRQQNKELAQAMRLNIRLLSQVDASAYRLIALVDAQPSFFGDQFQTIKPTIVFDHHPRQGDWQAELADIRPQYGALSTVLTEYLLCARIRIPRNLHTALLYGIKTDTDNFDRETLAEDIRAYTYHTRHANMRLIRRIELNQTPMSYLKYFDHAFHTMKHYRGRRVGFLGHVESPDVCVQVADFYLRLIGTILCRRRGNRQRQIDYYFPGRRLPAGLRRDRSKRLRTDRPGGGHRSAARIEIPLDILKTELKGDLSQQSIDHFLNECLKKSNKTKEDPPATKT